jgi:3-hydroxybutyryl-CoA dehydrogenase
MSQLKPLQTIGICGAGQMGAAMAVSFRRAGYRTLLWLRNPNKVDAVARTIAELDGWLLEHVGPPSSTRGTLEVLTDLSKIDNTADVIVDCIAEEMHEKVQLFQSLGGARARHAIFLTTTSGLSITELGRQSGTGPTLVGTHFWNPPHLMPLVEVVRGDDTEPQVIDRVVSLIESIGKIPVRVNRDVPGFIGNRLLHAMWREAIWLVQNDIASSEDIDRVARLTFGLRMPAVGPLENMDLVGLDLIHTIHEYLLATLADDHEPQALLQDNVKNGKLGMKSGQGFHDWHVRNPQEVIDHRDRQIVHQLQFLQELGRL